MDQSQPFLATDENGAAPVTESGAAPHKSWINKSMLVFGCLSGCGFLAYGHVGAQDSTLPLPATHPADVDTKNGASPVTYRTELTAVTAVSAASFIQRGFAPDASDPTFISPKGLLFNLEQPTDFSIIDAPLSYSRSFFSNASEEESSQIAAHLSAGGNGDAFAGSFSASILANSNQNSQSSVKTMRYDYSNTVRIKTVLLNVNLIAMRQKLAEGVEDTFNSASLADIYREYGAFRVVGMELGGVLRTTVEQEMRQSDSASAISGSLATSMTRFTASATANASGTSTIAASESVGRITVTNLASGGEVQLWLGQGQGAIVSDIQHRWSLTINDDMAAIGFQLEPLSHIIRFVNATKADAFDLYCTQRWNQEAAAVQREEALLRYALPWPPKPLSWADVGLIVLYYALNFLAACNLLIGASLILISTSTESEKLFGCALFVGGLVGLFGLHV